ncbi:MAG: pilus assembly protein TadG-related protein [Sulfobacillus sp.]|nr:pilus assembly protein TadG-related protein [Sulfobacillus sp.]
MKLSREHSRQGQSLVIVALMLTVLLGVAGTGLTVGTVYYARTRLQNAVDAAALAGAQTYQNPGSQASLISQDDPGATGTVEWNTDIFYPNTVVATGSVEVPGGFAQIFGFHDFTVRARAVASPAPGWPFDFAIFQGSSTDLSIDGTSLNVVGGIHSNGSISLNGGPSGKDIVTGVLSATSTVSPTGLPNTEENAPYIPMPIWTLPSFPNLQTENSNWTVTQSTPGGNYFVNGSVTIDSNVTFNGSIEATGGITYGEGDTINGSLIALGGNITSNGGNGTLASSTSLVLAALPYNGQPGGNITFNGANNSVSNGVVYAPDGRIKLNGSGNTFVGSIVGNVVDPKGSGQTVKWNQSVVDSTPFGEPVLIQ